MGKATAKMEVAVTEEDPEVAVKKSEAEASEQETTGQKDYQEPRETCPLPAHQAGEGQAGEQ